MQTAAAARWESTLGAHSRKSWGPVGWSRARGVVTVPFDLMSPSPTVLKTLGRTLNFILNVRRRLEGLKKGVT